MNPFREKMAFLSGLQALRIQKRKVQSQSTTESTVICPACKEEVLASTLQTALWVCPGCGHHFPLTAQQRLAILLDEGSVKELNRTLRGGNPLHFAEYDKKLAALRRQTGLSEAVLTVVGTIGGCKAVVGVLDSRFLMGSMGAVVGEKITRAVEYATRNKLALILLSASGGARMQEGILSLFQMAKTAAALERHSAAGLLYISVFTHPTTGGVTASFASLGDIMLAEPRALIGFAGPRVIEQTIRQTLPQGFQKSEYLLEHGLIDAIVSRKELKSALEKLLALHGRKKQ